MSGGIKVGDIPVASVGQTIGSSFNGGQIGNSIGGVNSSLDGQYKKSEIKSGGHGQNIWS